MKHWAGYLLLLLLLIQTTIKTNAALLPEMLWICYPATLLLAIGLLLDVALLSASGFLFHLCVGLPAYLLMILAANEKTNCASFLIHFFSPVIGLWVWRGKRLPIASCIIATCLTIIFVLVAYFFTAPELNINLAFKVWNPAALGFWGSRALNTGLILSLLLFGRVGINRCLAQTTAESTSGE